MWLTRHFDESWGLPRVAQGTGMPVEEATNLRLPSLGELTEYAHEVWSGTDHYLNTVDDRELERVRKIKPFGEIPVAQAIGQTVIAHGYQHLGEILLVRELQGLKGVGA